jgi:drug/metabolite transporter (DMT)-like permease
LTSRSESPAGRRRLLAASAVVLGAVATATNPVFVRISDVDLVASAFHRMAWAIPMIWLWSRFTGPAATSAQRLSHRHLGLLLLCGALFAADLAALHASISLTNAANAILFLNAQPIYVVVGSWLLFGTLVTRHFLVAAGVSLLGAAMLAWHSLDLGAGQLLGDGLGVVAGLFYAGYILAASRLRSGRSSAQINLWTCLVGAPILLLAALSLGQDVIPATARDWGLMIGLGVVSQALGQGLIVWGLAHLPTSFSSVALLTAPVAAAVFAWLLLDEALTLSQIGAMALVLTGVYGAWRASMQTAVVAASPSR